MKTRALALIALCAALAGCRENLGSVAPFGVCAPPEDATTCSMEAECGAFITGRAFVYLDVAGGDNELLLWMQWNNQMLDNSDETTGRVNTHNFYIEEYKLSFSGPVPIPDITVPTVAPLVPSNGTATSLVPVIPVAITQYLKTALPSSSTPVVVVAEVVASGRLGDDSAFETGSYRVAIDVVNDTFPGYACPNPTDVVVAVCPNVGQPASVACETLSP